MKVILKKVSSALLFLTATLAINQTANADFFDYQINELQFQYGRYEIPFTGEGEKERENGGIWTIQHADGWKYGDNFFFVDFSNYGETGRDIYGEFYANFSLGKITGKKIGFWRVKDMGVIAGINYGREADLLKYLPGVRLSWDLPGFAFLNTDFTLYLDGNGGLPDGIPKEDDSYMVDVNWAAPFDIGKHSFSIEGHVEYIGRRDNEFGDKVSWHVLGQPQFRYDLGKTWFGKENRLFVGVEWQFWLNKNDDPNTNESAPQLLIVGRM